MADASGAIGGLLRICTAGSVDDGKSTLIGRLLLRLAVGLRRPGRTRSRRRRRTATPGRSTSRSSPTACKAEREQGITIDVAYRYFATARRKFILADTPGHEQYTRNMATGASTADVAILLVDARNGVRAQSRRHARIARLLGITDFVLAINKMDLVDFDRDVFDEHPATTSRRSCAGARVHAIPMSALHGDNVITTSERTPWFDGPPLLEYPRDGARARANLTALPFRFPVQLVLRPDDEFRGYAGQIASGTVRVGDRVTAWPSGRIGARQAHRHLRRRPRHGVRADVGHADARRRDRHQPRRRADRPSRRSSDSGSRPRWSGWTSGRSIPARVYLLKHATRTVTAEVNHGLVLNQIGTVHGLDGAAARVRPLRRQPRHRQLHPDRSRPRTSPRGAGMIINAGARGRRRRRARRR